MKEFKKVTLKQIEQVKERQMSPELTNELKSIRSDIDNFAIIQSCSAEFLNMQSQIDQVFVQLKSLDR